MADYWLYGQWVFTPFRYFDVNLLQSKASEFGVTPFWQYFVYFYEMVVPPLSIALLLLFCIGIFKKPIHLFTLIIIPFILGHFLIGHKELRFLFPVIYAFIFLAAKGLEGISAKYSRNYFYRIIFVLCAIVNFGLLLYKMFSVAETRLSYYKFIYKYAKQHEHVVLVSWHESPYKVVNLQTNFYKPKNFTGYTIKNTLELIHINSYTRMDKKLLFLSPNLLPPPELAGYKMKRVYTPFPSWVLKNNVNNWQDRTSILTVYEMERW